MLPETGFPFCNVVSCDNKHDLRTKIATTTPNEKRYKHSIKRHEKPSGNAFIAVIVENHASDALEKMGLGSLGRPPHGRPRGRCTGGLGTEGKVHGAGSRGRRGRHSDEALPPPTKPYAITGGASVSQGKWLGGGGGSLVMVI